MCARRGERLRGLVAVERAMTACGGNGHAPESAGESKIDRLLCGNLRSDSSKVRRIARIDAANARGFRRLARHGACPVERWYAALEREARHEPLDRSTYVRRSLYGRTSSDTSHIRANAGRRSATHRTGPTQKRPV